MVFKMDLKSVDFHSNKVYLDNLLELHHKYTTVKCENTKRIKELEEDNEELKRRLQDLIKNRALLEKENINIGQELEGNRLRSQPKDLGKYFDFLCELLGYSLSDVVWDKTHKIQYIKCCYDEECYIRLGISSFGLMELLEFVPQHPNFDAIQEHFRSTQDASSLLAQSRKYFKAIKTATNID